MPNYSPANWWECDLLAITKSDFMVEFEIKLSKSDFKRDVLKNKTEYDRVLRKDVVTENKHNLLHEKSSKGPSRFYYVVPEGMFQLDEIPEFAGLLEIRKDKRALFLNEKKTAPRLNSEKVDPKIFRLIDQTCYYRFWNCRNKKLD